ncbi:hypothetical protein IE53DRAFT_130580 [Violaceomyces palustris]|uniref:Uncharacterized protein n=1 Tax=Violaceomyces palustris TaxID=1673888 RepID=A0ACD0NVG9_9BASI|nr:hypothetical protein IE53DRAFT_130580 [Violaceomyces palustris]
MVNSRSRQLALMNGGGEVGPLDYVWPRAGHVGSIEKEKRKSSKGKVKEENNLANGNEEDDKMKKGIDEGGSQRDVGHTKGSRGTGGKSLRIPHARFLFPPFRLGSSSLPLSFILSPLLYQHSEGRTRWSADHHRQQSGLPKTVKGEEGGTFFET